MRALLLEGSPSTRPLRLLALLYPTLLLAAAGCGLALDSSCETDSDCAGGHVCLAADGICVAVADAGAPDGGAFDGWSPPPGDGGAPLDGPVDPTDGGTVGADACVDADLDGDGFGSCAGDCDDTRATVFPGAGEICGDLVTNDCLSGAPPDAPCMGLGTFVSAAAGDDANPGTMASPVATVAEGMSHARMIGGGVDVYVAEGVYPEDVTMSEGISLYGGYEPAGWTRDPGARRTELAPTSHTGVTFPSGVTRATALDGFLVRGAASTDTTAITVLAGADPVIRGNEIRGGRASRASRGVFVNPSDVYNTVAPLIEGNRIFLGQSGTGSGSGARGVEARRSAAEIVRNEVQLIGAGNGQRGISVYDTRMAIRVEGNVVRGTGSPQWAEGIAAFGVGGVIEKNDVSPGPGTYTTGLALGGELRSLRVENNLLFGGGGRGATASTGLVVSMEGGVPAVLDLLVHSNLIAGGDGNQTAGVLLESCSTSVAVVGRFYGNIIDSGRGAQWRYGVVEVTPRIDPEAFEANALHLDTSGSFLVGGLYRDEGHTIVCGAAGVLGNVLTGIAAVNFATSSLANLDDDCDVRDPTPGGDFHLDPGSACIDAGTALELPGTDLDGEARPLRGAPDIGPDEVP